MAVDSYFLLDMPATSGLDFWPFFGLPKGRIFKKNQGETRVSQDWIVPILNAMHDEQDGVGREKTTHTHTEGEDDWMEAVASLF